MFKELNFPTIVIPGIRMKEEFVFVLRQPGQQYFIDGKWTELLYIDRNTRYTKSNTIDQILLLLNDESNVIDFELVCTIPTRFA